MFEKIHIICSTIVFRSDVQGTSGLVRSKESQGKLLKWMFTFPHIYSHVSVSPWHAGAGVGGCVGDSGPRGCFFQFVKSFFRIRMFFLGLVRA